MADVKYFVTVDSETGLTSKIERVGEGGELKEIDLSKLFLDIGNVGGTTIVVNIYGGGVTDAPGRATGPTKGVVKLTDGDDFCICFPRPPGRGR